MFGSCSLLCKIWIQIKVCVCVLARHAWNQPCWEKQGICTHTYCLKCMRKSTKEKGWKKQPHYCTTLEDILAVFPPWAASLDTLTLIFTFASSLFDFQTIAEQRGENMMCSSPHSQGLSVFSCKVLFRQTFISSGDWKIIPTQWMWIHYKT